MSTDSSPIYFLFRFEYDVSFTRGRLAEPDVDYKDIYIGVRESRPAGHVCAWAT